MEDLVKHIDDVRTTMDVASEYDLQVEVMTYVLLCLKEDNSISIEEFSLLISQFNHQISCQNFDTESFAVVVYQLGMLKTKLPD
jgi:hypothetical protein